MDVNVHLGQLLYESLGFVDREELWYAHAYKGSLVLYREENAGTVYYSNASIHPLCCCLLLVESLTRLLCGIKQLSTPHRHTHTCTDSTTHLIVMLLVTQKLSTWLSLKLCLKIHMFQFWQCQTCSFKLSHNKIILFTLIFDDPWTFV